MVKLIDILREKLKHESNVSKRKYIQHLIYRQSHSHELALYIYQRLVEDQEHFQLELSKPRPRPDGKYTEGYRHRVKTWPSGLFIDSRDIKRYINEYI